MKFLPLKEISEDMFLAHAVIGNDGRVLLNKGTRLTSAYLHRLEKMEYTHLYVYESPAEDWNCTGLLSDRIRIEAIRVLRESLIRVVERKPLDEPLISFIIEGLLKDVLQQEDRVFDIIDIKTPDNYLYNHSLNVAVISVLMGRQLQLEQEELKEIALGAFLHDLGKAHIKTATKKIHALSVNDTVHIKQHTTRGFETLQASFSLTVANIANQHHEREDGSGYPLGLSGVDIPLSSKIVGVANAFETMVADLWNDQALERLTAESPAKYNPKVVRALRQVVAFYPVGSVVELTDGEQRVVVAVSTTKMMLQNPKQLSDLLELPVEEFSRIAKRVL
ncbi:MAG: HD domain-containing protein [Firmicutes bacterium]|nr:HD domain-containing protein [Bacillota bacterium]